VALAIYLDRVTASLGEGSSGGAFRLLRRKGSSVDESVADDVQDQEEEAPLDLHMKIGA
jgi:hypothetical protein